MEKLYIVIAVAVLLGLLPAFIVRRKGGNFYLWWVYGSLLFLVALPHSLGVKPEAKRMCPYCHNWGKTSHSYCAKCGYEFIEF